MNFSPSSQNGRYGAGRGVLDVSSVKTEIRIVAYRMLRGSAILSLQVERGNIVYQANGFEG